MECHKYGDDFNVGDVFKTEAITVTETHLVMWAGLTMDYFSLHTDAVYASKTSFGERLAHGPLIFALAVGLTVRAKFAGDSVLAWLGADNMRMVAPVKIADTISVSVEVIDKQKRQNQGEAYRLGDTLLQINAMKQFLFSTIK